MIIEVQEMGSFKKKILINKVRQLDKAKMASGETPRSRPFKTREIHMAMKDEKRSNYISKTDLNQIVAIARAHALWFHMITLKEAFKFTGKQLSEFREKLKDVYRYAIDDTSGGAVKDIIEVTVKGSPKEDEGSFGYTDYQQDPFDADGYYLNKIEGKNAYQAMHGYKKYQRTYQEFQNSEIASMLVLHDYFGFRIKRIRRFIETIRAKYDVGIKSYMEYLEYLEKLCKEHIEEFDCIRKGQGIFDDGNAWMKA